MTKAYIGIDCGATNLRVGLVDESGNLLALSKVASPLKTNPENFAKTVKEELNQLLTSTDSTLEPLAIGVGTPGPLDLEKGLLLPSSNIGNKGPVNFKGQFDVEFDSKVYFDRDTNLALLGESWKGSAVGAQNVVMLTLGTGVGGAIMVDGNIDHGESGKAGEIGHMIIQVQSSKFKVQNASRCGLGHQGCFEALINSAKDLDEFGTYLGYGLANISAIFNPDKILIGGGKRNLGDFLPKAVSVMREVGMKPAVDEVEVLYAKLEDNSGVFGGARLAIQRLSTK